MASRNRVVVSTQVYLTNEQADRLRRVAHELCVPQASIIRAGVDAMLDDAEATRQVPARVRAHVRWYGEQHRNKETQKDGNTEGRGSPNGSEPNASEPTKT